MPSERPSPVRVFALGTFTHENKGDAALLAAFRDLLDRILGPVELRLTSTRLDLDRPWYGPEVVPMPLDPHGLVARAIHRLGRAVHPALPGCLAVAQTLGFEYGIRLLGRGPQPRFGRLVPAGLRAAWREMAAADLVAAVPGGYLMAPEPSADLWLYHASSLILAHHLGRRVVLFPSSYGPFVGIHRLMARRVLDRSDWIMAREAISLKVIGSLRLRRPVLRLVPDVGFAFRDDGRGEHELEGLQVLEAGDGPLIGVSAKPHHFPGHSDAAVRFDRYLSSLAAAADHAVQVLGARVVFVPQSVGSAGEDREIGRQVAARMASPERAAVVERELSPHGLSALYGRFELMIGTRMHANILAMATGVPALAIAYEHKTPGIMAMVGLPDLVVHIEAISPEALIERLDDVWAQRSDIHAHLASRIPALVASLESGVEEAIAPHALQALIH